MEEKKIVYAEVHNQVENDEILLKNITLAKGQAIFVRASNDDLYNKLYINLDNTPKKLNEVTSSILITKEQLDKLHEDAIQESLKNAKESGEFNGYTPLKGVDYFTEEDKQDIIDAILKDFVNVAEVGQ